MKLSLKRTGALMATAALATTLAATGAALLLRPTDAGAEEAGEGLTYFYNKLGDDQYAKRFYELFQSLDRDGVLKTGKLQVELTEKNVATKNDVEAFVENGNLRIPKAYGAGRDSYLMDHPDLFYVDLFGTSLNAGQKGSEYVAYLDSSRVTSLYVGEANSESKVASAIAAYEAKLTTIVNGAKAAGDAREQIAYVNRYFCENVEYSFGIEVRDGKNVDTPAAAYIYSSYGSLVNGKAVCEGYAKGFKAVMDRLNIPCVCVSGYSVKESGSDAHMWNTVKLDGNWYNIDVTWNATSGQNNQEKWFLLGTSDFDYAHESDPVISSSGFELDYPAVSPYDYGSNEDGNGMNVSTELVDQGEMGKRLDLTVVYEEKNGEALHEENKYLAFRFGDLVDGQIQWGLWSSAVEANVAYAPFWEFKEKENVLHIHAGIRFVQFALIGRAPDENGGAVYPESAGENAGKPFNYMYKTENLKDEDFIVSPSAVFENEGHGSYMPSPWGNPNLSNGGALPVNGTYDFRFTYTESLERIDPGKSVELSITTARGNDTVMDRVVISDFEWDGDKVISFRFTPSPMYIHNGSWYDFVPTNLQGVKSKKVPDPVRFTFKSKSVVCSKVFNDGRLYMNVFGTPQLLDTSDISVTDFKDENGNYYAESQRSQLMLVVNRTDEQREDEMRETLLDETPVKSEDILSSASYEINLQICGVVKKVPNGSYMQVAFGFPQGYSAEDAGTTFKIYHYKHDDKGQITGVEEIPAIITEYGIIARVESFSPFMIVALKKESAAATVPDKAVYASVSGSGTLTTEGKSGISFVEGDTISYKIEAKEGYKVTRVLLNGKVLDASLYANGTLTLKKEELNESNTLEAVFMTSESVQSYENAGVVLKVSEAKDGPVSPVQNNDDNAGWIIGLVVAAVVLVCGAGIVTAVFLVKKKQSK